MRIRSLRSMLFYLVLSTATLFSGLGGATEKKFPPYPDVWGRLAPVPEDIGTSLVMHLYRNPDGDRLITMSWRTGASDNPRIPRKERALTFFGGQLQAPDAQESDRIFWTYEKARVDQIIYANGDVIKSASRTFAAPRCGTSYNETLIKTDKAGNTILSKMLFLIHHRPRRTNIWEHCSLADGKDSYVRHADSQYLVLEPLEDDTFLGRLYGERYVVRFKADLTSPFIDNERLFLVDTAIIDRLVEEAYARPGQAIQNANDAIRDYLLTLKKGN